MAAAVAAVAASRLHLFTAATDRIELLVATREPIEPFCAIRHVRDLSLAGEMCSSLVDLGVVPFEHV